MAAPTEKVLRVPRDLVENTPGFALDFGGSVIKMIYRSKEDAKYINDNKDSKHGTLRLVSFTRENLDKGVKYLEEKCDIKREGDTPTEIFTTGVGSTQYKTTIQKALNVKMSNLSEMDCFVKALTYLRANLPAKDFVCEDLEKDFAIIDKEMDGHRALLEAMKESSKAFDGLDMVPKSWIRTKLSADTPMPEDEAFPCIMAMLGSAFALMKVEKDGSFEMLDMSNRGGRQFLGLGSILTGAKSYDELIALAEKGDISQVSSTMNSFKTATKSEDQDSDNMYGKVLENDEVPDTVVFSFGNAPGKRISDYKREDIAIALLHTMLLDLTTFICQNIELSNVRKVFMAGGFTSPPFVRKLFTQEFLRRALNPVYQMKQGITFHFLQQGQSLGTVGAYINNIDKFCKMPEN